MGSQEESLKQQSVLPECGTALAAYTGQSQPESGFFYQIGSARNVTARGGKSAAGVFDK